MRFAYAGDRAISVNILRFLLENGDKPLALFVSDGGAATHSEELIALSGLDEQFIFRGNQCKQPDAIGLLKTLELDYIIGIHFPYIIPSELLELPRIGFLNLHPAYLPFNKGWHTPSWAILEKKPYGATLHFMSEALDQGDIIAQEQIEVQADDTADTLYAKVLKLEEKVFYDAYPSIRSLSPNRVIQTEAGTSRRRKDMEAIAEINLDEKVVAGELIDKLRALTTNNFMEAAYFIRDGKKIHIQVILRESK